MRPTTPLALACLLTPVALSQAFDPGVLLQDSIAAPMRPLATDLDGDGDEDLLVASSYDGVLGWFERTGPGQFEPWALLSDGVEGFDHLVVADLDGDGDPDLALADYWDDSISWLENLGGAELAPKLLLSDDTMRPIYLGVMDVDGDGAPDLIAGSTTDKRLEWYRNLGGGTFAAPSYLADPLGNVGNPSTADLDGDGVVDVLVTNSSLGIGWFRGLGSGSFAGFQLLAADMSLPVRVATMDVDGDLDPDVLCLSAWDSTLAWYPNTAGVLGPRQVIEPATGQAQELFLEDMDGDGDLDLLLEDAGAVALGWYANLGTGAFGPQQTILTATAGYIDAATTDLDGDGDLDVVRSTGLPWEAGVQSFENLGGTWGSGVVLMDCFVGELVLDAGDLDGDGDMDLAAGSVGNGRLVWLANLGGGTFGPLQEIDGLQGGSFDDLEVADLDGDGKPDLLAASRTDDLVMWYRNLGAGSFDLPVKIAWGYMDIDDPFSVAAVDFDNDGDLDVLGASNFGWALGYFENLGGAAFAPKVELATTQALGGRIETADLTGDGLADLALAHHHGELTWVQNLGGGAISLPVSLSTTLPNLELALAVDLDGDNDLDLVTVSSGDDTLARFENLGAGAFGPRVVVDASVGGASGVTAVDGDGDGDQDLVMTAGDDGEVLWFENLGAGVLASALVIDAGSVQPSSTVAADFDGDGDLDLVSARRNQLAYHEQVTLVDCDGDGVHDPTAVLSGLAVDCDGNLVPDACDLAQPGADIDGDGQLDACVPPPLMADGYELSVAAGGARILTLSAASPGHLYLLLGSTSGTSPGTPLLGVVLPLNVDPYLLHGLLHPNKPPLTASLGLLKPGGPGGTATATFTLPPAFDPILVGLTVHHAYLTWPLLPGVPGLVSNPVPIALLP